MKNVPFVVYFTLFMQKGVSSFLYVCVYKATCYFIKILQGDATKLYQENYDEITMVT